MLMVKRWARPRAFTAIDGALTVCWTSGFASFFECVSCRPSVLFTFSILKKRKKRNIYAEFPTQAAIDPLNLYWELCDRKQTNGIFFSDALLNGNKRYLCFRHEFFVVFLIRSSLAVSASDKNKQFLIPTFLFRHADVRNIVVLLVKFSFENRWAIRAFASTHVRYAATLFTRPAAVARQSSIKRQSASGGIFLAWKPVTARTFCF